MKFSVAVITLLLGFLTMAAKSELPKAADFVEIPDDSVKSSKPLGHETAAPTVNENEKTLSGTVRVLRKIEHTEVFFKDLPDSYVIPSGNGYSSIFKAFTESQKTGSAVSFRANTKSRRVLSIEDAAGKPAAAPASGAAAPAASTDGVK